MIEKKNLNSRKITGNTDHRIESAVNNKNFLQLKQKVWLIKIRYF